MRFQDIVQFTEAKYSINVGWSYLEDWLAGHMQSVDLNPPYQRPHVWTPEQQIAFIEFCLRGGESGNNIYFNCATWDSTNDTPLEIVDGKQRITAVRRFMADEIPVFGYTISQYEDKLVPLRTETNLTIHVNNLKTEAEVIQWYLDLNYAGTPHTDEERVEVEQLLMEAQEKGQ